MLKFVYIINDQKEFIMKDLLLGCFLLANVLSVFAQKAPITLDTTYFACEYKTRYHLDTLSMNNYIDDDCILQVGSKISKYYSKKTDAYERVMCNPKAKAAYDRDLELALQKARKNGGLMDKPPLARYSPLVIYNNYPQGKRTIQDAAFFDYYIYEDNNAPQQWTLVADSAKTILGYSCKKATCSYRGRNYEAWYSPDLPVSVGPWKFSGLPGLIMTAQDTKAHYTFEIKGLMKTKEPIQYIEYSNCKYTHTDRLKFLRLNAKSSQIGILRYMKANAPSTTANTDIKLSDTGQKYDLQERDY